VRIEFKERRTEITDADREERMNLISKISNELTTKAEFFARDIMSFQDRYE